MHTQGPRDQLSHTTRKALLAVGENAEEQKGEVEKLLATLCGTAPADTLAYRLNVLQATRASLKKEERKGQDVSVPAADILEVENQVRALVRPLAGRRLGHFGFRFGRDSSSLLSRSRLVLSGCRREEGLRRVRMMKSQGRRGGGAEEEWVEVQTDDIPWAGVPCELFSECVDL